METANYTITKVKRGQRRRNPLAPFITSTLQQDASRRLGFTAKRTMAIAQSLYEGIDVGNGGNTGLITYMRTDSTRVSNEAVTTVRDWIASKYGSEFVSSPPRIFKNKKVFAAVLKGWAGLFAHELHEGKHLGKELAEYVRAKGEKGFAHSDEDLKKYGIEDEVRKVRKELGAGSKDLLMLSAGTRRPIELVFERLGQFSRGIPEDTRRALPEGSPRTRNRTGSPATGWRLPLPPAGRNRACSRRAWKDSKFEHEEISRKHS